MQTRPFFLMAGTVALFVTVSAVNAAVVTTTFANSSSVGLNGISKAGSTTNSKFGYVGGNTTTSTSNSTFPSFEVYDVDGAAVLNAFRTTVSDPTATLTSISGLSLQLYDELVSGATPGVAGGFNFNYATNATTLTTGSAAVKYDSTAIDGLTTQLGALTSLGSGAYTPATVQNTALGPYVIGSSDGDAKIMNDINAGVHFYLVVSATTAATEAQLDGWYGSSSITKPTLTITATTPEPASIGLAAMIGTGLLRRRRVAN